MEVGLLTVLAIVAFLIYMLPWFIAWNRGHANTILLFFINLILGASGIVWIICLIWAIIGETKDQKDALRRAARS